jgi:hypothetical protein
MKVVHVSLFEWMKKLPAYTAGRGAGPQRLSHPRPALTSSFWDGPKNRTSDAQLHIGESRDSQGRTGAAEFDASHRPGMTGWIGKINALLTIHRAKIAG